MNLFLSSKLRELRKNNTSLQNDFWELETELLEKNTRINELEKKLNIEPDSQSKKEFEVEDIIKLLRTGH
ncbi:MAG: hypothetical protein AB7U45_04850 [Desulfamplus sp.]